MGPRRRGDDSGWVPDFPACPREGGDSRE